jgi:hypothetical protein
MERGVVGEVRSPQYVAQVFDAHASDPGIISHIARIVETQEVEAKVACV